MAPVETWVLAEAAPAHLVVDNPIDPERLPLRVTPAYAV